MKKETIIDCQDIDWQEVEALLEETVGEMPEGQSQSRLLLPDLALIQDHVLACSECGETLIGLARKHGINQGTIYQAESQKPESKPE